MTDTTHPPGSPVDSRPTVPATAGGAGRLSAELIEKLADAEHASWAGWMDYLFSKCSENADGSMTIPAWGVERWKRQVDTAYADLSESEKQSDRDEVAHIVPFIEAEIRAVLLELVDERDSWKSEAEACDFSCRQAEAALVTAERERDEARRERDVWRERYDLADQTIGEAADLLLADIEEDDVAIDALVLDAIERVLKEREDTRARRQQAEAALAASESRARALREALEWIAHFDRAYLDSAKTLHYDMAGVAQQALAAGDGPGAAPSGEHAAMIVKTPDGWETVCSCGWRYESISSEIARRAEELHMNNGLTARERQLIEAAIEPAPTTPAQGSDQEGAR